MKTAIPVLVLLQLFLSSYGQDFKKFDSLGIKADSAYKARNYSLSAKYYENAIQLREDEKPEIFGSLYYSMACVYALGKEKEKALSYLERSFTIYNAKSKSNPVSANELTTDVDLDFIRDEPRFKDLLNKYYPKFEIDFSMAKEVSYSTILEYLSKLNSDHNNDITISNKVIYWQKSDTSYIFNDKTKTLQLPNFEVLKHNTINFSNCTFKLHFVWANFNKAKQHFPYQHLVFEHCNFDGKLLLNQMYFESSPRITKCNFNHDLCVHFIADHDYYGGFTLDSSRLKSVLINIEGKLPIKINIRDNTSSPNSEFNINCNDVDKITFLRNEFPKNSIVISNSKIDVIKFESNYINNLIIQNTELKSEFDLQKSTIVGKLLFYESYFSNEPVSDIDWKNLNEFRLGYLKSIYNSEDDYIISDETIGRIGELGVKLNSYEKRDSLNEFISGERSKDFSDEESFQELVGLYSMFLNLYKNKGDLESYNACFVAIKELQSKRLEYLYSANGTFETYFRWKLSRLLKFYVRHGTDPARAIVISLYIVFGFGVFFFFFPSDWDVTSKTRLLQNFRDFAQKNEKGYIVPFFILLGGFTLSLLNALTLSLNAFITLGFGNIPTHGIARYVCVLEGFMGWFLLSIFTVALINQVI